MDFLDQFNEYLAQYESNKDSSETSKARKVLIERLLEEEKDILNNHFFDVLMDHDEVAVREQKSIFYPITGFVTLHKAILSKRKGLSFTNVQCADLFTAEVNPPTGIKVFYSNFIDWLIDIEMGNNEDSVAKDLVLSQMAKKSVLEGISDTVFTSKEELSKFEKQLQSSSQSFNSNNPEGLYEKDLLRGCLTLFLIHLALEDSFNANYYLLKAISFNNECFENPLLLKYLESVYLTD